MRNRPILLTSLILWLGLAFSIAWIVGTNVSPVGKDFHGFYNAARVRAGLPIDGTPTPADLSVPILAVLIAPLARLPLITAYWTWTGLGVLAIAASLWRIWRVRRIRPERMWFAIGALFALMPCLAAWVTGQVTWLLTWLVTQAWASASPRRAGIWLGIAIALKPPLALMAILLPWRIWSVSAITSLGLVLVSLPVVGISGWLDWMAIGRTVDWLPQAESVSFWGWAARLSASSDPHVVMGDLPVWSVAAILVAALALTPFVRRAPSDRRWGLALIWSLWVSPLGWFYYLPLALGPMLSSLPSSWIVWTALFALLIPWPVTGLPHVFAVYSGCVLLFWIAWVRPPSGDEFRPAP